MKKLFLGLGAMAGAMAVVALSSCNGSQKVTYKDADGNDKEVVITSTEDKEQVVEAATAIAYSESTETVKPHAIGLDLSFDAKVSGKMGDQNMSASASADLELDIDLGQNYKKEDMVTYAKASITASAPVSAISAMMGDNLSAMMSADFTKNDKISIAGEAYGDAEYQYFTATKLEGLDNLGFDADSMKDVYYKLSNNYIFNMASGYASKIPGVSSSTSASVSSYISQYLNGYKNAKNALDVFVGGQTQAEFKTYFATLVDKLNLTISKVSSSEVTFKMNFTKDTLGKGFENYTGDSYVALSIDTQKKMPVAIKLDMADLAEYEIKAMMGKDADFDVSTLKASLEVTLDPTVKTLDASKKSSATDIANLMK